MQNWDMLQTDETLEPPIHVATLDVLKRTPVTRYEKGRRCQDCDCVLSVYNPGPNCCTHTPLRYPKWKAPRRF